MGIRPSSVRIDGDGIPARLYLSENLGESVLLNLFLGDDLVKVRVASFDGGREGDVVPIAFDPAAIHLFDTESGLRIPLE
jgi:ABC-type sugar transport system ATPase subunit